MSSLSQPFPDLLITTVSDGPFFVNELFQKKFGASAPEYGNSVICFYRNRWDHFIPVCYTHFLPYDEVVLVGGAMTDGHAFTFMPPNMALEIRKSGGIYYHVLKFAFDHFKNQCSAYFGHAGDQRAYEVDIQAGFEPTEHEHLIAHFHKPITADQKELLISKVHSLGPF